MKKFLPLIALCLFWYDIGNAGIQQPGPGEDNSKSCIVGALDAYKEAQEYLIKIQKKML